MNCGKCPHWQEIEAALYPCQLCGHAHLYQSALDPACEKCPQLKKIQTALEPCNVCESGKMHGQVSIDAAADQNLVLAHRLDVPSRTTSAGCSTLSPDDEDAVRVALATVFEFEPLELLLIQHLVNGGTLTSFNEPLRKLVQRIKRKGYNLDDGNTNFRALVFVWKNRIIEKMPTLEAFFNAMKSQNAYTHKRRASLPIRSEFAH